jgi:hypothetical protein
MSHQGEDVENQGPAYRECFVSLALGLGTVLLILAVLSFFGPSPFAANGRYVNGMGAVLAALLLTVGFAAIFAGLQKLGYAIWGLIRRGQSETRT